MKSLTNRYKNKVCKPTQKNLKNWKRNPYEVTIKQVREGVERNRTGFFVNMRKKNKKKKKRNKKRKKKRKNEKRKEKRKKGPGWNILH